MSRGGRYRCVVGLCMYRGVGGVKDGVYNQKKLFYDVQR